MGAVKVPRVWTQTYRPPTGCCVFSCSLLHEATPVTKGVRYVFLPFLYDEAARKVREDNFKYVNHPYLLYLAIQRERKRLH